MAMLMPAREKCKSTRGKTRSLVEEKNIEFKIYQQDQGLAI